MKQILNMINLVAPIASNQQVSPENASGEKDLKTSSLATVYGDSPVLNWELTDNIPPGEKLLANVGTPHATGTNSDSQTNSLFGTISGYDFDEYTKVGGFNRIIIHGDFDFHTYSNQVVMKELTIYKDYDKSSASEIVYRGEFQHKASNGWGNQTSTIGLTVNIKPIHLGVENSVNFEILGRVYAGTSGSVHKAYTALSVDSIEIGIDANHTTNDDVNFTSSV